MPFQKKNLTSLFPFPYKAEERNSTTVSSRQLSALETALLRQSEIPPTQLKGQPRFGPRLTLFLLLTSACVQSVKVAMVPSACMSGWEFRLLSNAPKRVDWRLTTPKCARNSNLRYLQTCMRDLGVCRKNFETAPQRGRRKRGSFRSYSSLSCHAGTSLFSYRCSLCNMEV